MLAGLYVGVGTGVSTGKGMAVAVDGGCVAKSMGQGVGVGVHLNLLAEVTILALPSVHEARKLRESRVWVPVASE